MIGNTGFQYRAGGAGYAEQVCNDAGSTTGDSQHKLPIRRIDLFDELSVQCADSSASIRDFRVSLA